MVHMQIRIIWDLAWHLPPLFELQSLAPKSEFETDKAAWYIPLPLRLCYSPYLCASKIACGRGNILS
jgi:hypothetical protein